MATNGNPGLVDIVCLIDLVDGEGLECVGRLFRGSFGGHGCGLFGDGQLAILLLDHLDESRGAMHVGGNCWERTAQREEW